MKFQVADEIIQKYPDIRIAVIIVEHLDTSGEYHAIMQMLADVQDVVRKNYTSESIGQNSTIRRWRKIYSEFGSKPSDYRCSAEALLRSVTKGRAIRHINNLVDIYNFISLKYIIPAGGEDLDKVQGNIYLTFAAGNEKFVPLGSETVENPYVGEVIYCDDRNNVLCRRWNWRESDKTKLTEETTNAIVVLEGFDETVDEAAAELGLLIQKFCGGKTKSFIVDKETTEIEW